MDIFTIIFIVAMLGLLSFFVEFMSEYHRKITRMMMSLFKIDQDKATALFVFITAVLFFMIWIWIG